MSLDCSPPITVGLGDSVKILTYHITIKSTHKAKLSTTIMCISSPYFASSSFFNYHHTQNLNQFHFLQSHELINHYINCQIIKKKDICYVKKMIKRKDILKVTGRIICLSVYLIEITHWKNCLKIKTYITQFML